MIIVGLILDWSMRDSSSQGKGNFINNQKCDWNDELYCLDQPRKKSQIINRVINLGENGYFKDLGITIELKSTSGRRKDLSEMAW